MLLCTMKITNTILRSTRLVGWMGESVTLNDSLNYSPCRRQQIEQRRYNSSSAPLPGDRMVRLGYFLR